MRRSGAACDNMGMAREWASAEPKRVIAVMVAARAVVTGQAAVQAATAAEPQRRVIVVSAAGSERALETTVAGLGGRVLQRLGLIDGFVASLTGSDLSVLASDPAVASVTPDS